MGGTFYILIIWNQKWRVIMYGLWEWTMCLEVDFLGGAAGSLVNGYVLDFSILVNAKYRAFIRSYSFLGYNGNGYKMCMLCHIWYCFERVRSGGPVLDSIVQVVWYKVFLLIVTFIFMFTVIWFASFCACFSFIISFSSMILESRPLVHSIHEYYIASETPHPKEKSSLWGAEDVVSIWFWLSTYPFGIMAIKWRLFIHESILKFVFCTARVS
jgi:hypothetical protein